MITARKRKKETLQTSIYISEEEKTELLELTNEYNYLLNRSYQPFLLMPTLFVIALAAIQLGSEAGRIECAKAAEYIAEQEEIARKKFGTGLVQMISAYKDNFENASDNEKQLILMLLQSLKNALIDLAPCINMPSYTSIMAALEKKQDMALVIRNADPIHLVEMAIRQQAACRGNIPIHSFFTALTKDMSPGTLAIIKNVSFSVLGLASLGTANLVSNLIRNRYVNNQYRNAILNTNFTPEQAKKLKSKLAMENIQLRKRVNKVAHLSGFSGLACILLAILLLFKERDSIFVVLLPIFAAFLIYTGLPEHTRIDERKINSQDKLKELGKFFKEILPDNISPALSKMPNSTANILVHFNYDKKSLHLTEAMILHFLTKELRKYQIAFESKPTLSFSTNTSFKASFDERLKIRLILSQKINAKIDVLAFRNQMIKILKLVNVEFNNISEVKSRDGKFIQLSFSAKSQEYDLLEEYLKKYCQDSITILREDNGNILLTGKKPVEEKIITLITTAIKNSLKQQKDLQAKNSNLLFHHEMKGQNEDIIRNPTKTGKAGKAELEPTVPASTTTTPAADIIEEIKWGVGLPTYRSDGSSSVKILRTEFTSAKKPRFFVSLGLTKEEVGNDNLYDKIKKLCTEDPHVVISGTGKSGFILAKGQSKDENGKVINYDAKVKILTNDDYDCRLYAKAYSATDGSGRLLYDVSSFSMRTHKNLRYT